MSRPDYPIESARRARSLASQALHDALAYLDDPKSPDYKPESSELRRSIGKAQQRLEDVRELMASGDYRDGPHPAVLDAVERAESAVVKFVVLTDAKTRTDIEATRWEIHYALQAARTTTSLPTSEVANGNPFGGGGGGTDAIPP